MKLSGIIQNLYACRLQAVKNAGILALFFIFAFSLLVFFMLDSTPASGGAFGSVTPTNGSVCSTYDSGIVTGQGGSLGICCPENFPNILSWFGDCRYPDGSECPSWSGPTRSGNCVSVGQPSSQEGIGTLQISQSCYESVSCAEVTCDGGCAPAGDCNTPGTRATVVREGDCSGTYLRTVSCDLDPTCAVAPVCGNGIVESGEACDTGASNGACPATCSTSCTVNSCGGVCGNGIVESGEVCDNGASNGACPATCSTSCNMNSCASSLSGACSASSCTAGQQNLTITWSSNDTLLNAECGGVSMGQQGGSGTSVPLFCPASPTTCTFTSATGKTGSFSCTITPSVSAFCGDGSCNGSETCSTCSQDCGSCPVTCSPTIENLTYTCPSPSTIKVYPGIYDPTGMGCSISPPNRVWRCQGTTCNPLSGTYFDYSGSLLSSFTDPVTKPNLTSWTYKIQNIASGNLSNPFSNSISCGPTLSATLSARINSTDAWSTASITGTAPVNDVDLRTTVGGTAAGTVNLAFFDNHNDAHTAFDAAHTPPSVGAYVAKYDGVDMSSNWGPGLASDAQIAGKLTVVTGGNYTVQILALDTFIVNDLADYPTGGTTYYPKVVAERSTAPTVEDRLSTGVIVNWPALSASCSVSPNSAFTGQNVTWSASASGGTGSYTYSWNGSPDPNPLDGRTGSSETFSYSNPGNYTGSVTVTSGAQTTPAVSCVNSVAVAASLPQVDIRANGSDGTTPPLAYNSSASITWCGSPASVCQNADSCSVTKDGSSWQAGTSGTFSTGALKRDTVYILTCTGPGGTIIDSVTVDISSSPDVREVPPD